jgi:hypothetical protein
MVGGSSRTFGHAKRMRNSHAVLTKLVSMARVHCETCGFQYAIEHPAGTQDEALAQRQAEWLAERFVWDHIQETRHPGSIPLPILPVASTAVR